MAKNGVIRILACLLTILGLTLGCVDPDGEGGGGSVTGTSLYVFDASEGAQSRILVYSDVAALFEDSNIQPSRRLSGAKIDRVRNLAWGGMCFDSNGNRLYLVSESGDVVRIERARSPDTNGELTNPVNIVSFRLGTSDSDRLANGKFGQASMDPRGTILYVTESNASDTRIWVVTNPGAYFDGLSVGRDGQIFADGDKGGTGVAAANDAVYAYFDDGNNSFISGDSYAGPRLRRGNSSGFQSNSSVIIGRANDNRTRLAKYGSLAVDNSGYIYLARHLEDAAISSGDALLIFRAGQFNPGLNQTPEKTFAAISNLRVISHAVTRDWLVGALSDNDYGRNTLLMWRSPSMGASASVKEVNVGLGVSIRGLALDGSN